MREEKIGSFYRGAVYSAGNVPKKDVKPRDVVVPGSRVTHIKKMKSAFSRACGESWRASLLAGMLYVDDLPDFAQDGRSLPKSTSGLIAPDEQWWNRFFRFGCVGDARGVFRLTSTGHRGAPHGKVMTCCFVSTGGLLPLLVRGVASCFPHRSAKVYRSLDFDKKIQSCAHCASTQSRCSTRNEAAC